MKVQDWLSRTPVTCRPEDSLQRAAQLLWEHDLGALPVVDGEQKLVGMLTDRDLCMAAFTRGSGLAAHSVASAMARIVHSLAPKDSLAKAHALMRTHQIRRVPVVDGRGAITGVLTLSDMARKTSKLAPRARRKASADLTQTLSAIVAPRAAAKPASKKAGRSMPAASASPATIPAVLQPAPSARTKRALRRISSKRALAKARA